MRGGGDMNRQRDVHEELPMPGASYARQIVAWAGNNATATLTLLAALIYATLRLSYSEFYSTLGVAPEDVGLDYAEILGQSAFGAAITLALISLALGAYLVFIPRLFNAVLTVDPALLTAAKETGERKFIIVCLNRLLGVST